MSLKIRQKLNASYIDGIPTRPLVPSASATAGVGPVEQQGVPVQVTRIPLRSVEIAIPADDEFGAVQLVDLPDRNIHLLNVEADITLVKGGVTNGLVAAVDIVAGIGTVTTASKDLSNSGEADIIEATTLDTNALTLQFEAVGVGQSTATYPQQLADAATNDLFLNIGVVGMDAISAADTVTATGFVDLYWIDLGNRAS